MNGLKSTYDKDSFFIDIKPSMEKQNISVYRLSRITGIKYDRVKKYYEGDIYRIDLSNLAKICRALNCKINDVVKYKNK